MTCRAPTGLNRCRTHDNARRVAWTGETGATPAGTIVPFGLLVGRNRAGETLGELDAPAPGRRCCTLRTGEARREPRRWLVCALKAERTRRRKRRGRRGRTCGTGHAPGLALLPNLETPRVAGSALPCLRLGAFAGHPTWTGQAPLSQVCVGWRTGVAPSTQPIVKHGRDTGPTKPVPIRARPGVFLDPVGRVAVDGLVARWAKEISLDALRARV